MASSPEESAGARPDRHPIEMTFAERRESAQFLVDSFKPERFTYLALTTLSAAAILALVVWLFVQRVDWTTILTLFGPSGVIVYSQGRVLQLWNRTAMMLMGRWNGEDKG